MSRTHYLKAKKYTLNLVDQKNNFLLISAFIEDDKSAYLKINSASKIDDIKFTYHPRSKKFKYAFTDTLWKKLHNSGIGRPNKERTKSEQEVDGHTKILCHVFIDKSSLFRTDKLKKKPDNEIKINFPDGKIFRITFSLEKNVPMITSKFIDLEKGLSEEIMKEREIIYSKNTKIDSSTISGIAQLMNDFEVPWKLLVIGV